MRHSELYNCASFNKTVGLTRVSCTKSNGYRIALLALITRSIYEPTSKSSNVLPRAMRLICQVSAGLEFARSEGAVIKVLEWTRERLQTPKLTER
jgi:hypothetical protein